MFALFNQIINKFCVKHFLLCVFVLSMTPPVKAVVFVDENANGTGDGSSWINAHTTIQAAIDNPDAATEQIWVGTGTYEEIIVLDDNRKIYGGFIFGDDELSDRDSKKNRTMIDASFTTSPNHVVTISDVTGIVLDGFTISGGVADGPGGSFNNLGGGIFCNNANSSNVIRDCTIANNFAVSNGGGIFCRNNSSPQFINCAISGNSSDDDGGGIGLRSNSSPTFINCIISGNAAGNSGGAISCGSDVNPIFNNCNIVENTAANGGGVFILLSSPTFINSIFKGNTNFAVYEGGAASDPTIKTTIFNENTNGDYRDHDTDSGYSGATSIQNNAVGGTLTDLRDGDPLFVEDGAEAIADVWFSVTSGTMTSTLVTSEPLFLDLDLTGRLINVDIFQKQQSLIISNTPDRITIAGNPFNAETGTGFHLVDYHLQFDSIAVDTGTTEGSITFDFDGNARPFDFEGVGQDGPDVAIDIGAYELQSDILEGEIIFVDLNASGDNDGTSWENAYNQITLGINDPKSTFQEIWVAKGRYNEAVTLVDGNRVLGGFESGDSRSEDRDPLNNETIIDATIFASPKRVVLIADVTSTTLDGFTITGGDNTGREGGGILISNAALCSILNCRIINNTASLGGGVAILDGSDPQMRNVQITGNTADVDGGGVYCVDSKTSFTEVVIGGNGSLQDGGGIYITATILSRSTFDRCLISGNSAQRDAGGIFSENNSTFPLDFTNCIISGNAGDLGGGMLLLGDSGSRFIQCNISDNLASLEGGGVFLINSTPEFLNTAFTGNNNIALSEGESNSDPRVTFCMFGNNSDGDYFDADTDSTYFGADVINTFTVGSVVENNVDGATDFLMDSEDAIQGSWSANGEYDPVKNETTLLNASASYEPNELAGKLINIDTKQSFQAIILSNSETLIVVSGDLEPLALIGADFKIIDYRPGALSALLDQGSNTSPASVDLDLNPRPVDVVGIGFDGAGQGFDIGVYEFQNTFANIIVTPSSLDFGQLLLGENSTLELMIENDGLVPLELNAMFFTNNSEGNFSFAETPDLSVLNPGLKRSVQITFNPQSTGNKEAKLSIQSSDPDEGIVEVALSGEGVTVEFEVTPNPVAFGEVVLFNEKIITVTLNNSGSAAVEFTGAGIVLSGDSEFSFVDTPSTASLAAGTSRTLQLAYTPQSLEVNTGVLTLTTNNSSQPNLAIDISGIGIDTPNINSITQYLLGIIIFSEGQLDATDFNNDGEVNIQDILIRSN